MRPHFGLDDWTAAVLLVIGVWSYWNKVQWGVHSAFLRDGMAGCATLYLIDAGSTNLGSECLGRPTQAMGHP